MEPASRQSQKRNVVSRLLPNQGLQRMAETLW
jgi:hypothetical protein